MTGFRAFVTAAEKRRIFLPKYVDTPWYELTYISLPSFHSINHKQCDQKKLPNVYKSCPKMISLEK